MTTLVRNSARPWCGDGSQGVTWVAAVFGNQPVNPLNSQLLRCKKACPFCYIITKSLAFEMFPASDLITFRYPHSDAQLHKIKKVIATLAMARRVSPFGRALPFFFPNIPMSLMLAHSSFQLPKLPLPIPFWALCRFALGPLRTWVQKTLPPGYSSRYPEKTSNAFLCKAASLTYSFGVGGFSWASPKSLKPLSSK